jgi:hypothetical protein
MALAAESEPKPKLGRQRKPCVNEINVGKLAPVGKVPARQKSHAVELAGLSADGWELGIESYVASGNHFQAHLPVR